MNAPVLYPYQRRWLDDPSRFKIGMFARQTGKTFTTTLEIAEDIIAHDLAGRRSRWVILSRGERQAREAMDEGLKLHLKAYGIAFRAFESDAPGSWEDGAKIKAQEVILRNGSRVTALPADPDTARGFSANVMLDEFAFHKDSRQIWSALFPVVSKPGLKLRVVSTPNGKGNKFYELVSQHAAKNAGAAGAGGNWSLHRVDIHQAVAEGLPRDIDELREGCADEDAWRQEYQLEWVDEASAWLPWDLITQAEHDRAGLPDAYSGGPCFVGVDIGRRNDLFVIWVLELCEDVLWTREVVAARNVSFAIQDALLDRVFAGYQVLRCCMDQSGMGEKPVEDARRRHGALRVEGVPFTNPGKLMLATGGKQCFEERRIRIPLGDKEIRNDLHKLQKSVTPTGSPRFSAESDKDGHADRAWACFLAVHAAAAPMAPAGASIDNAPARRRLF